MNVCRGVSVRTILCRSQPFQDRKCVQHKPVSQTQFSYIWVSFIKPDTDDPGETNLAVNWQLTWFSSLVLYDKQITCIIKSG